MAVAARRTIVLVVAALLTAGLAEVATVLPASAARVGDTTTIPVPGTGAANIVTGADGNLWWGNQNINRTTLSGVTTSFATNQPTEPHAVAPGPDGNIWYVNLKFSSSTGANIVGRVTPAGVVTEFPVTPNGKRLRTLTAGLDGNLWLLFEEGSSLSGTPSIAKVTPTGTVTTYVLDNELLNTSIVAGPLGRIWWIDLNTGKIHSVDPANPTSTHQVITISSNLSGSQSTTALQVGADGNLWTSSAGSDGAQYLLRVTPTGVQTAFPVRPASGSNYPQAIVLGPDGNIWFTAGPAGLYRFNPDGTTTRFSVGGTVRGTVVAGPDGRIWAFNSSGSDLIGVSTGDTSAAVLNLASGFSKAHVRLPGPGSSLSAVFTGPTPATITDTTGMDLFNSGAQSFTATYTYTYSAAGTYTYQDTLQPSHTGVVDVPPTASPTYTWSSAYGNSGNFNLTWASGPPPVGFVYDVQWQPPGGAFDDYIIGTTAPSSLEQPYEPPGTYAYRARLRRTSDNAASAYSPEVRVRYGNANVAFDGYATSVSLYRPSQGNWYIHPGAPGYGNSAFVYGGDPSDIPVPADYYGKGKPNLAIYRPSTGLWAVHVFDPDNGDYDNFTTYGGIPGDVPVPADYDGDGKTDLAIFRPDFGTWWVHQSSTDTDTAVTFGVSGDIPVPGADFDGDGKADLTIYRNGTWYVHQSSDNAETTTAFGGPGDVPVPGYYDDDAKSDIAVFRPSNGVWYLHPSTALDSAIVYGVPGDIPAPGDYDADGLNDLAVFRPSSGTWYIHYGATGRSDSVTAFGMSGDVPLPLPPAVRLALYP